MRATCSIALTLCTLCLTSPATATLIELTLQGTNQLGIPGAIPAPFSATLRFDTSIAIPDDDPAPNRASFTSVFITARPPQVPPENNEVVRAINPLLVQTTQLSAFGERSDPRGNQLSIGQSNPPASFVININNDAAGDSIFLQLSAPGFFGPSGQFGLTLTLSGDGAALFPDDAALAPGLTAFDLLIGRDLPVVGSGTAFQDRASPLNAWNLAVSSFRVDAVAEPTMPVFLAMAALLLCHRRRRHDSAQPDD